MTVSPGWTPTATKASQSASVPEAQPTASAAPVKVGEFTLERFDFGAEDEVLRGAHTFDRGQDFITNFGILPGQIQHGDRSHPGRRVRGGGVRHGDLKSLAGGSGKRCLGIVMPVGQLGRHGNGVPGIERGDPFEQRAA